MMRERVSGGGYGELFEAFMAGGLQASLAQVRATAGLLDDGLRRQAWHTLSYALKVDALWPHTRALLLALAPKMEQAGFREEWLAYLLRGMEAARVHEDLRALAELGCHAGLIYRCLSRYDEAHAILTASAEIAAVPDLRARSLNQLAYVECERAHYAVARRHAQAALAVAPLSDAERATAKGLLGLIAHEETHYAAAIALHEEALAIRRRLGDQRKVAWSLQNIGYSLRRDGRLDQAVVFLSEATQILGELRDEYNLALALLNLGGSYNELDKAEHAVTPLVAAHDIFRRLGAIQWQASANLNLGLALLAQNKNRAAISRFSLAVNQYVESNSISNELNALDGLALAYLAEGEYEKAQKILEGAYARLPQIVDVPFHYHYLNKTLPLHLEQARQGAARTAVGQADCGESLPA